jgi:hypothetical protein
MQSWPLHAVVGFPTGFPRNAFVAYRLAKATEVFSMRPMNSHEFKRWLAKQGATFEPGKGSHLKVFLNGRQSVLPMHHA